MAPTIKNPPAVQETRVRSLGRGDPLEKEMATHSSILAWKIPQTEEPGGLQSMGSQRVRHDWATKNTSTKKTCTQIFTLVLFLGKRKDRLWCIHTMKYYSAIQCCFTAYSGLRPPLGGSWGPWESSAGGTDSGWLSGDVDRALALAFPQSLCD